MSAVLAHRVNHSGRARYWVKSKTKQLEAANPAQLSQTSPPPYSKQ